MKIPTVDQCRYLGITISTNNSDVDLKKQIRKLYANVNLLLRKFSKCSVDVKCFLFNTTYCSNLNCAPSYVWFDCTKAALKKLKIVNNNSLRRFMFLPWRNSRAYLRGGGVQGVQTPPPRNFKIFFEK